MPDDIFKLIQTFFNRIQLFKIEQWDEACRQDGNRTIVNTYPALLQKHRDIQSQGSNGHRRTNLIITKILLLALPNYLQAIKKPVKRGQKPIASDVNRLGYTTQWNAVFQILNSFRNAHFDLKDDHFVMLLDRLLREDIEPDENKKEIPKILKYVNEKNVNH